MISSGRRVSAVVNARIPSYLTPVLGGQPVDVVIGDGRILDIAPHGNLRLTGDVLDAEGTWAIPGLWDHHVHTVQWALRSERARLGDATSAAHTAAVMGAVAPQGSRRVGAGFRDALWSDEPSLEMLDATTGDVPTYLISADVHSVWLNSAALRREGFEVIGTGILREESAFEISRRLNDSNPLDADRLVAEMAAHAASQGVVGLVDFDMAWNEESWRRRLSAGFDALRVEFGIYPDALERAVAEGLRTGDTVRGAASDLVHVGSLKVITDGSLGTRTAACSHAYVGDPLNRGVLNVDPSDLIDVMTTATAAGISCAVHAIGDVANSHALDAFAATGAWGTIEHAQLVAHADLHRFARLGVGASVQPAHAIDDRDITDALWAPQTALPFPLRAFADSGANLLFGSDAPVAPLDPWATIAAAVHRTRDGRAPWHPEQTVDIATAIAASVQGGSGSSRTIVPGAPADIALCERDPLACSEVELRTMRVAATMLGGRLTHQA